MFDATPSDLARYAVRPLLPGPLDVLREAVLALGVGPSALPMIAERGVVEAIALQGLGSDQTRVLEREIHKLGGELLVNEGADRAVLLGSLSALGMLPMRLTEWGQATEALGAAIHAAVIGKGMAPPPLTLGDHVLRFGERTLVMGIVAAPDDAALGGATVEHALRLVADGADLICIVDPRRADRADDPDAWAADRADLAGLIGQTVAEGNVPVGIESASPALVAAAVTAGAAVVTWHPGGPTDIAAAVGAAAHAALLIANTERPAAVADRMATACIDLREALAAAAAVGADPARVLVDPGLGGGAAPGASSPTMIRRLGELRGLARPIVITPTGATPEGTIALAVLGAHLGADIVRVHDVIGVRRALDAADAISRDQDR